MANGTIAFDTLQTSGQITGTAKSVDTDFVVSGVPKQRITFTMVGTINSSLNTTSITDEGTGIFKITMDNALSDTSFSVATSGSADEGTYYRDLYVMGDQNLATNTYEVQCNLSGSSFYDATRVECILVGELA
tara:strand:- start:31 stop:429 length:399 start_codon:yes stop_codon:yes gene_type:complete